MKNTLIEIYIHRFNMEIW